MCDTRKLSDLYVLHPSIDRSIQPLRSLAREKKKKVAQQQQQKEEGEEADLAEAAAEESTFEVLYPDDASLKDKIHAVATKVYGADGVEYSAQADKQLKTYTDAGFGNLPVCIAKTHLSISSDPKLKGAPTGWTLPVREVRASVGAGFIYPLCGDMRTMPGLGKQPAAMGIDIDDNG